MIPIEDHGSSQQLMNGARQPQGWAGWPRLTMRQGVLIAALFVIGGLGSIGALGLEHVEYPSVALVQLPND